LFLPNILEAGKSGALRIFGDGKNRIAFTHVDNYCHGLCLGARALYKGSPALGQFYICTDGDYQIFWDVISDACSSLGFTSLHDKVRYKKKRCCVCRLSCTTLPLQKITQLPRSQYHLPESFMMGLGHICDFTSWAIGKKLKLNAFAVKMLVIHRWFDITNARNDLGYEPLITFEKGWADTIEWFRENWLPNQK
jgi:nucleoside-diphosphate-sugar epimerase